MTLIAEFQVLGVAKTAGSKKAFIPRRKDGSMVMGAGGKPRVVVTDDTGAAGKTWRTDVRDAAMEHFVNEFTGEIAPIEGAVAVEITFYRARPKGHYGSGRQTQFIVKDSAPAYPVTKPDVDKLSRAVLDALKGIAWHDDAQVTEKVVRKRYAPTDRTEIRILRPAMQVARDLPMQERVKGELRDQFRGEQPQLIAA